MKTFLLTILIILLVVIPASAAVSIDVNDLGNGWAAIEYTADSNVSAFGLKVTVDSGETIIDINNYHVGESTITAKGYGIFLGTIIIDSNGEVVDYGEPIAPNDDPGASGTGLDTNTVIIELGALYEDGNQPPLSGKLCELQVSGCCKMTVTGEATRCGQVDGNDAGAVLENGTKIVPDLTNATEVQIDYNCGCPCWFDTTGPAYLEPDGKVNTSDFNVILGDLNYAGYLYGEFLIEPPSSLFRICNDATGPTYMVPDGKIDTQDFNVLVGRLNYAMYLYGVYEYTCGDPTIDPNIYYP